MASPLGTVNISFRRRTDACLCVLCSDMEAINVLTDGSALTFVLTDEHVERVGAVLQRDRKW